MSNLDSIQAYGLFLLLTPLVFVGFYILWYIGTRRWRDKMGWKELALASIKTTDKWKKLRQQHQEGDKFAKEDTESKSSKSSD